MVQVGRRKILFDTGAYAARARLTLALDNLGLTPEDIDTVFLSHLHFDHCANCSLFPHATFVLTEREFLWASECKSDPLVHDLTICYLRDKLLKLVSCDKTEIAPNVEVWFTPGHTPGSASLLVYCPDPWCLAGDSVKNRIELTAEMPDISLDKKESIESIRRLKHIAKMLVPGHDAPLQIIDGRVIPLFAPSVTITLPPGMEGGDNGQFRLIVSE